MLKLLSLPLLASGLFIGALTLAVTATMFVTRQDMGAWSILTLPLPFGPLAAMALVFGGVSARD